MNKDDALISVKKSWRNLIDGICAPAKDGKSWVCPVCGHGEGKPHQNKDGSISVDGDGIVLDPESIKRGDYCLHCFGCGFHGDVIELYRKATGATFGEALQTLAGRLGITVDGPQLHTRPPAAATENQSYKGKTEPALVSIPFLPAEDGPAPDVDLKAEAEAQKLRFERSLYKAQCHARLNYPEAVAYLKSRGIPLELAERFNLGYAPQWVSPTARKKAESAGRRPPEATPRLIIPTGDKGGYIARDIRSPLDIPEEGRKFVKQNEGSPGLWNADALQSTGPAVFVVEGAIDGLSVIAAGHVEAVALNSTAQSGLFIKTLEKQRPAAPLVLCLDNDPAGRKAAKEIAEACTKLQLPFICADICGEFKDPNEALTKDKAAFESAIKAAIQAAERAASPRPDVMQYYVQFDLERDIKQFKEGAGRKLGFKYWDQDMGGVFAGMHLLGALSSLGKTSLMLQTADQVAAAGHDVIFFSIEQSRLELFSKSIARLTEEIDPGHGFTSLQIRQGYSSDAVRKAKAQYMDTIARKLTVLECNFSAHVGYLVNYIRQYQQRTGATPLVILDYLQLLQVDPTARVNSPREQVDLVLTTLKRATRDYAFPLFAISSVNRANYLQTMDFSSFKESGAIEFTGDVVWGLQYAILRDPLFDREGHLNERREKLQTAKKATPREIELVCLKNRFGKLYSVDFHYFPQNDRFVESPYQ